jgi:hypothetical protein
MIGGALNYDENFKGMKNNLNLRPAKYLVAAVMKINSEQVTGANGCPVTRDFTFDDDLESTITVNLPGHLGTSYTLTKRTLFNDFTQARISFGHPGMNFIEYAKLVRRNDVHNARYGALRNIYFTDEIPLMVHASAIITSCHVRPTIDFRQPDVRCLTGDLIEQPAIISLNASGIDNTKVPNLEIETIALFLGYYNSALIDIIKQNKITHLCLVQIGLGVFAGKNQTKKTAIVDVYAQGILSLKAKCPTLTYIYLPDNPILPVFAGFFTPYHEQFRAMGLTFVITNEDALGKAFELKQQDAARNVAYLNPSDSVVTFGSFPVGALCMVGMEDGFVGEEFVGQATTGIFFNAKLLCEIIDQRASGGAAGAAGAYELPVEQAPEPEQEVIGPAVTFEFSEDSESTWLAVPSDKIKNIVYTQANRQQRLARWIGTQDRGGWEIMFLPDAWSEARPEQVAHGIRYFREVGASAWNRPLPVRVVASAYATDLLQQLEQLSQEMPDKPEPAAVGAVSPPAAVAAVSPPAAAEAKEAALKNKLEDLWLNGTVVKYKSRSGTGGLGSKSEYNTLIDNVNPASRTVTVNGGQLTEPKTFSFDEAHQRLPYLGAKD